MAEVAEQMPTDLLPHLAEYTIERVQPGNDFGDEFEFGLNLILDGLAAAATEDSP